MPADKLSPEKTCVPSGVLLGAYLAARDALENFKAQHFYHGAAVTVSCGRYVGPGTAVTDNQCPPDQVAVLLEHGNVWWYFLDDVTPNDKLKFSSSRE